MQTPSEKTSRMLLSTEQELFDRIVDAKHPFRRLNEIIDFPALIEPMRATYSTLGANGIDVEKGVKALLIQFWEDYSDREMEKAVLDSLGLFGNVFTFIDASTIISKTALWEERDRALRDGAEKLNNKNVEKYAADTDARWGAKSETNIWFGHKRHAAVDMRHGLVTKVSVTAANVPDFKAIEQVLHEYGAVFTDKLYDTKKTEAVIRASGCHPATIRKNTNKEKNRDLDRWRSGVRMPFEGVFSKMSKFARYRGHAKVVMQAFFQALVHNLKKAVRWLAPAFVT